MRLSFLFLLGAAGLGTYLIYRRINESKGSSKAVGPTYVDYSAPKALPKTDPFADPTTMYAGF